MIRKIFKIKDVRDKMMLTIIFLSIYCIGNTIPIPFIDRSVFKGLMESVGAFRIINTMSGSGLENFSLFPLSIYPYITASIVIQLLVYAIPTLKSIQNEGETGRKRIEKYTMILGLILTAIQGLGIITGLFKDMVVNPTVPKLLIILAIMVVGEYFLIKGGQYITEKGIGNGISLLIFAGITQQIPRQIAMWYSLFQQDSSKLIYIIIAIVVFLVTLLGVVIVGESSRNVPIQYAKRNVGTKLYGNASNYLPLKVNISGVMPVIFATSILAFPQMLSMILNVQMFDFFETFLMPTTPIGLIVNIILTSVLITVFTFFYSSMSFDLKGYVNNIQAQGGFIPGIRPGKPTLEYLSAIINKLNWVGSIFLSLLAVIPMILESMFNIPIGLSGTTLIILASVAIETMAELDSQLQLKSYEYRLTRR